MRSKKEGQPPRKIGRPPRKRPAVKYGVSLPYEIGEWAKNEAEGLSGLCEKLLEAEMKRRVAEH